MNNSIQQMLKHAKTITLAGFLIACANAALAQQAQPVANAKSATAVQYRVLLTPPAETTLSSPQLARVDAIRVNMGDAFAAGQELVRIDCQDQEAKVAVSMAELSGAVETHEAKLRMKGLEQASDVEVALAAASVQKIKAEIKFLQQQIARCSVTAPWAGRVSKIHARAHMTVGAGESLIELVRSGPLNFRVNLPSDLAGRVRAGHKLKIQVDETGKSYDAVLLRTTARIDPVSQTIEGEGRLTRDHNDLLPGMSGQAQLQ